MTNSSQYYLVIFVTINSIMGLPQQNRAQNPRRNGRQNQVNTNDFGFNPDFQGIFISNNDDQQTGLNNTNLNTGNQQQPSGSAISQRPVIIGDDTTTTTASPAFRSCMNSCRSVFVYNPVCATDGTTYENEQRLNCARRCGANIQLARGGTCSPL